MDRRGRGFCLNNLSDLNLREGRIDEAASFARQALSRWIGVARRAYPLQW